MGELDRLVNMVSTIVDRASVPGRPRCGLNGGAMKNNSTELCHDWSRWKPSACASTDERRSSGILEKRIGRASGGG